MTICAFVQVFWGARAPSPAADAGEGARAPAVN